MTLENAIKVVREWQPGVLPTELKYRDSLTTFLRGRLKNAHIENEYRHHGTTIDIYLKIPSLPKPTELYIELKRNLLHKAELDRLVGQLETLKPGKNNILVVLCGDTKPALFTRLKDRYPADDPFFGRLKGHSRRKSPRGKDMLSQTRIAFAALLIPVLVSSAGRSQRKHIAHPVWPTSMGEYVATSSEGIPLFPRTLSGYRFEPDKDFWNKPFPSRGTMRVFSGDTWKGIHEFPNTMNGCSAGVFMIRWRASDPSVRVQSSLRYSKDSAGTMKAGSFGYMSGTNCEQPMFKFAGTINGNESSLVDVYYELKFWQAAP